MTIGAAPEAWPGIVEHRLLSTPSVSARRLVCRPETLACSCEECSTEHQIVMLTRGAFIKQVKGEVHLADPTRAIFFNAFEPYRIRHIDPSGDECVVLSFESGLLEEALGGAQGFAVSHRFVPAVTHFLNHEFVASCGDAGQPFRAEEIALGLLQAALGPCLRAPRPTEAGQRHVAKAEEALASRPEAPWRLAELARVAGVSQFHLSRLFKACTGESIARRQTRLRIAEALVRIRDGETNLSFLAADLGFSSHSHFTAAFRRLLGKTPSEARMAARAHS